MTRRQKQRENRTKGRIEAKLDSQNMFGIPDPTPRAAVKEIRIKQGRSA